MPAIKVFVIHGSVPVQKSLTSILRSDRRIAVIGAECDPYNAREPIKALSPDVLLLDIETNTNKSMTFLRNLMRLRPMPVVAVSSLRKKMAERALVALELGAVEIVSARAEQDIIDAVKAAHFSSVRTATSAISPVRKPTKFGSKQRVDLIGIGASTGGVEALRELVCALPGDTPPIVVAQHIPPKFSEAFAIRLNNCADVRVCEARHGQDIEVGCVYIAPGDCHLRVVAKNGLHKCQLTNTERVNYHRPSVDVLFESLVLLSDTQIAGVLLTGMGKDGAEGLKRLRESGAFTIAQDEATSTIWGMPGYAVKIDAADSILPLQLISSTLLSDLAREKRRLPKSASLTRTAPKQLRHHPI